MSLIGYDLDGTLDERPPPPGSVVITGRTFAEYDERARRLAQHVPVYIRGTGRYGDREHAARFKSHMIDLLGVTTYFDDDPVQVEIIRRLSPGCEVLHVGVDVVRPVF